jgi:hypothetical protein
MSIIAAYSSDDPTLALKFAADARRSPKGDGSTHLLLSNLDLLLLSPPPELSKSAMLLYKAVKTNLCLGELSLSLVVCSAVIEVA